MRRRPLLVAVYSIEAVATLSLLFVHDRSDVWILYAMAVFIGIFGTLAASARSALMTTTIPQELLGEGNAIFQSVREGLRLIAPLVGAGIYAAWGGGVVAIVDSVSFVFVVAALLMMNLPEPRFERVEHNFITEAMAGARHIVEHDPAAPDRLLDGRRAVRGRLLGDDHLRRHRPGAAPAAVVPGRAQHAAGSRRDRGRGDRRTRPADDRRRSHRRDRHGGLRDRRSHASSPRTCR